MDSTTVKVHLHGLGAPKKRGDQNIGKNVAGKGSKIPVIMGKDDPISIQLTGANVQECEPVLAMLVPLEGHEIQRFVGR